MKEVTLIRYWCFLFLFPPFLSKVLLNMEDLKVQEMEIFEYKKKIAEAETKLKQQQNLYEAVRAERNNYSKNLLDAQVYTIYTFYTVYIFILCTMHPHAYHILLIIMVCLLVYICETLHHYALTFLLILSSCSYCSSLYLLYCFALVILFYYITLFAYCQPICTLGLSTFPMSYLSCLSSDWFLFSILAH